MADQDGSSIRIKVAQYFVNKKLQELESKNPPVKIDDWTYLQALPQYGVHEPEQESELQPAALALAQQSGDSEAEHRVAAPSQLPPLFPIPTDDHISWNNLLKYDHKRLTQGGVFPVEGGGDSDSPKIPSEKPQFPPEKPKSPPEKLIYPPWYCVAIIGAGVAGLRTAMLLQERGIPYKIFEASGRPGGRLFTYKFPPKPPDNPQGAHDFYDVGAMRFPNNDASKKTFELFEELGLTSKGKVVEYIMSIDENIRFYNSECRICMSRWSRALTDKI